MYRKILPPAVDELLGERSGAVETRGTPLYGESICVDGLVFSCHPTVGLDRIRVSHSRLQYSVSEHRQRSRAGAVGAPDHELLAPPRMTWSLMRVRIRHYSFSPHRGPASWTYPALLEPLARHLISSATVLTGSSKRGSAVISSCLSSSCLLLPSCQYPRSLPLTCRLPTLLPLSPPLYNPTPPPGFPT